jgi:hypothetical protein
LQYPDLEMNITAGRSLDHFRYRVNRYKADAAVAPVADERRSWARFNLCLDLGETSDRARPALAVGRSRIR